MGGSIVPAKLDDPRALICTVRRVDLSTHAIGGISKADFILAAKLDELPVDYSPKGLEKQQQQAAQQA